MDTSWRFVHELLDVALQQAGTRASDRAFDARVIHRAAELAEAISVGLPRSHPAPSMSPMEDGRILFTLYGNENRETDLYVEDNSGDFSFVLGNDRGLVIQDGRLPISEFARMATWLSGIVDVIPT